MDTHTNNTAFQFSLSVGCQPYFGIKQNLTLPDNQVAKRTQSVRCFLSYCTRNRICFVSEMIRLVDVEGVAESSK